jgi:diguanylate cyclase (GGDEF)-like protein
MEIKLYLRMIQRSWWIVVLTALAAVLAALVSSFLTTPIYSSSSRYIVSPNPLFLGGDVDYNLIYSLDTLDKRTIITTYAEVLNSPRIYAETIESLGMKLSDLVDYTYSATVFPETNIIEFTVQGPNPEIAALITTRVGQRAVDYVESLYQIYEMGLLDPASVPTKPISPQPLRDAGVALVLGIALGIGLALVRELLRAPLVNFLQQRKVDEMSQALNRATFQATLRDLTLGSINDFCLCLVHLEGLGDYMSVLPHSTLQNIFRHVNQVLKNQLRGNDLVGRWDDLDFSVLLSDTGGQAAWNTMNRVQTALSIPIKIDVSGEDLELRPIIGIAEYRVGDTVGSLTKNINWAVDVAKKNGGIYMLKATEAI